jgi:hypothetical protein
MEWSHRWEATSASLSREILQRHDWRHRPCLQKRRATNTSHNRRREGKGGKEQRVDLGTVVVGDRHGRVVGISETIISHIGISIVVGPADEIVIIRGIVTNEVLLLRPLASDLWEWDKSSWEEDSQRRESVEGWGGRWWSIAPDP